MTNHIQNMAGYKDKTRKVACDENFTRRITCRHITNDPLYKTKSPLSPANANEQQVQP